MDLSHQYLLAMPNQREGYFGNSLIYVCKHDDEGAFGLVINDPSHITYLELFVKLGLHGTGTKGDHERTPNISPILHGGPVDDHQVFVLHSSDGEFPDSLVLGQDLSMTASMDVVTAMANNSGPKHALIALGYTGWGPGQLEAELGENAWLSTPADKTNQAIMFNTPHEQRVPAVAKLLGFDFTLISSQSGNA